MNSFEPVSSVQRAFLTRTAPSAASPPTVTAAAPPMMAIPISPSEKEDK